MNVRFTAKALTVFLGDTILFYTSLLIALLLRSGTLSFDIAQIHFLPFTIIFVLWILVFYIAGLYDVHRMRNSVQFFSYLFTSFGINIFLAIGFFYLFPFFGIAPKTTLVGFAVLFFILETFWRRGFNRFATDHAKKLGVVILGNTNAGTILTECIDANPHLGYMRIPTTQEILDHTTLQKFIQAHAPAIIVVPDQIATDPVFAHILTTAVVQGIEVHSEIAFYEQLLRQVPLASVTSSWFFDTAFSSQTLYDQFKRTVELIAAIALQIILLPLELLLAAGVAVTSRGPIFYSQTRVGKHNQIFRLYKFRSMRTDAEKNGAQWSSGSNDPRVTVFGKFLRHSHLDELPQLFNIIRGEISFVGPRPERPEIIEKIAPAIPFYEMRHMVTPGITGWAQINFKKDQTLDDVRKKLEFDLYYIKNRSFLFDIAIIIRTARSFFINQ